ncbi:phage virion morphogenesis protein [Pseudomonas sp. C9-3]|uniref:phage virion morphogenesis protein n=1 Tax=Pseudomonas sp. C9-3 TaxID=3078264 RepID=UPI0028EC1728|nr:phage virion morphogenesis protein [Pseudomonas sp. C9-3]
MSDDLEALEAWAAPILQALQPAQRRQLAVRLARVLRRSQAQRITSQRNPDGSKYEPRKPRNLRGKAGSIRRQAAMFRKLRTATYLKATGDANGLAVGFTGRIANIARVHQLGLRDRAEPRAPEVKYPERKQLGFTAADLDLIRDGVLDHLEPLDL